MSDGRKLFGTDGIRGVANTQPLDPETLVKLGKAIAATFINENHRTKILIGKDTRLSGYMIETALSAGVTSMGADVLLVGPLPTPGVSYLTRSMRADAGIMISASHNSFEDNGIKIFGSDGNKLPDSLELKIEALLEPYALGSKEASAHNIGKASRIDDATGRLYRLILRAVFQKSLHLRDYESVLIVQMAQDIWFLLKPARSLELKLLSAARVRTVETLMLDLEVYIQRL